MIVLSHSVADVTIPTFLFTSSMNFFALTVDNEFMSHKIMQNIGNAVRILRVKYMYVRQTATIELFSATLQT